MIAVGAAKIYAIDLISVWIRQKNFFGTSIRTTEKQKQKKQNKTKENRKKSTERNEWHNYLQIDQQ